jgi:hypothetical protein
MIQRGSSRFVWVLPGFSFWWSEPFLGDFLGAISRPFSWGFGGGYMYEPFVVLFPLIPLPNPWEKGLDFRVFVVLGFVVFLAEILRFLLIQWGLVDHNLAMECPWGVPTIPKVLFESLEWIGRSRVGFGGVDLLALFIRSYPGTTSLTGALDGSDQCAPFVGFVSGEFLGLCVLGLCCCWSILSWFGVLLARLCEVFFFLAGCVLGLFLFQGLEKSLRLLGTFVVRLL